MLSEAGSFSFTCTATVEMDKPCSASASVSGTAVGKKQSKNDSLTPYNKLPVVKYYINGIWHPYAVHIFFACLDGTLLLVLFKYPKRPVAVKSILASFQVQFLF